MHFYIQLLECRAALHMESIYVLLSPKTAQRNLLMHLCPDLMIAVWSVCVRWRWVDGKNKLVAFTQQKASRIRWRGMQKNTSITPYFDLVELFRGKTQDFRHVWSLRSLSLCLRLQHHIEEHMIQSIQHNTLLTHTILNTL